MGRADVIPFYEDAFVTLFHSDCREVLPMLEEVNHIITDPPYSRWTHEKQRTSAQLPDACGSALAGRKVAACRARYRDLGFASLDPCIAWWCGKQWARLVKRWCLIFTDAENQRLWQRALERGGLEHVRVGAWRKTGAAPQFTGDRPATGFEAIEIGHRPGKKRWNGGGKHGVWEHPIVLARHDVRRYHTTPKPTALMRDLILDFTDLGDTILDPFAGSGSTGVAAKECGRKALLIEIDEASCEIVAMRLAETSVDERIALGTLGRQGAFAW